jgi:hypothetical protein
MGVLLADRSGAVAPLPESKLTAARLVEVFLINEAYADEHYVNKEVELTGKVARVSHSKYSSPNRKAVEYVLELDLEGAGKGRTDDVELLIFFDEKDRAQLAKLKPGQTVVVRGQCGRRIVWSAEARKRDRDYSQVHLRDCTLVDGN